MGRTFSRFIKDPIGSVFGKNPGAQATSDPAIESALLDPARVNEVISRLMGLTGQGPQTFSQIGQAPNVAPVSTDISVSPFFANFQSAVNDRFTPTGPENQLLQDIMDRTSAGFARRGLGTSPVAATSTAASIAPSLVQLRTNRINELGNAISQWLSGQQLGVTQRGQDITSGLTGREQDITQRGQDITAGLTQRTNMINDLLKFLEFGKRTSLGQISRGAQPSIFSQLLPGGVGGGGGGKPPVPVPGD